MAQTEEDLLIELGGELESRELRRYTRDLGEMLSEELGTEVTYQDTGEAPAGAKGIPGMALLLKWAGQAVDPLMNAVKKILTRERELTITIKTGKGEEFTVTAKNINDGRTLNLIETVLRRATA